MPGPGQSKVPSAHAHEKMKAEMHFTADRQFTPKSSAEKNGLEAEVTSAMIPAPVGHLGVADFETTILSSTSS